MLVKLKQEWMLHPAGRILDLIGPAAEMLINRGVAYNAEDEKSLPLKEPIYEKEIEEPEINKMMLKKRTK